MRKVTTINLNGRAYQLEEQAYEKLQVYLHSAEAALTKNPDKKEVMADIEQAIADKCDRLLKDGKNVVTSEQVADILEQMGEVESDGDDNSSATATESNMSKRLFVIQEGAMLMGVCKGLGAYLGIEPNLVRVAFILLTIFTGGFWIIIYLLLGLFLPTAKTNAELAEAYGKPITAQTIVARAKERAPDPEMLQRFSQALLRLIRVIAKIISILAAISFAILTAAWFWVVWQLVFGRLHFYDQLQAINGWHEWLAIIALYLIVALPILLVALLFKRVAGNRHQTRATAISEGSLAVLWGVSIITLVAFGTAYAQNFRDYANAHQGRIDVGNSHACVNSEMCSPDNRIYYHY